MPTINKGYKALCQYILNQIKLKLILVIIMKILITGAASGIAKQVACKLAKKKYFVYLSCHTKKQADKVSEELKHIKNIKVLQIDITNNKDRQKTLDLTVDILYNHAGIGQGGSILEADMDKVRENFQVNVFSSFQLLQDILKQMIKKDYGKIIVMSSLTALIPSLS